MSEPIPQKAYMDWSLPDLDWLHEYVGLGAEWLASARRRELAAALDPTPAAVEGERVAGEVGL